LISYVISIGIIVLIAAVVAYFVAGMATRSAIRKTQKEKVDS